MAGSSSRYRPGAQQPEENKFGYIVFYGRATDFHHRILRSELKMSTAKKDDDGNPQLCTVIQSVVENLRGEAMQVATDIGTEALVKDDGTGGKKLMDTMRKRIFPTAKH